MSEQNIGVNFTSVETVTKTIDKMKSAFTKLRDQIADFRKQNAAAAKSTYHFNQSVGKTEKAVGDVSKRYADLLKHFRADQKGGLDAPIQAFKILAQNAKMGGSSLEYAAQRANLVGRSMAGMRAALIDVDETWKNWGKNVSWTTLRQLEANKAIRLTGTGIELLKKNMAESVAQSLGMNEKQSEAFQQLSQSQAQYTKLLSDTANAHPRLQKAVQDLGKTFGTSDASVVSWKKNLLAADNNIQKLANGVRSSDSTFKNWVDNLDRAKVVQAEFANQLKLTSGGMKIHNAAGLRAIGLDERMAASKNMLSKQYTAYGQGLQTVYQTNASLVPIYDKLIKKYGTSATSVKAVTNALLENGEKTAQLRDTQQKLNEQRDRGTISDKQYAQGLANSAQLTLSHKNNIDNLSNSIDKQIQKGTVYGKLLQDNVHRGTSFNNALREGAKVYGANSTAMETYGNQLKRAHQLMTNTIMSSNKTAEAKAKLAKNFDAARVAASMADGSLVELDGTLQRVQKPLNTVQRAFQSVGQTMKQMAQYATGAIVIYQLISFFAAGVREIIQFDQAMKDLQAIINATDADIAKLSSTVKDVAAKTKYSMTEVADGMKILGQSGLSTTEIVQAITHTSHLATGTLSTFKEAADLVTTAVRAFGLEFSDTQRVVDVFANAINRSKLTVDKIRVAFNYVAPVARAAGVSFEETTAALMALANSGIRASTMGTALRQILMHLQQPNLAFRSAIQAAGMTVDDVNPRIVGFANAIENLAEITPTAVEALQFFKLRAAPAVAILTQQGSAGLLQLEEAVQEAGAALRMFTTQTEGLGIKWKQVADRLSIFAINIGEAGFGGVLRGTADLLRGLLTVLNYLTDTMVGKAITGFSMMTGALLLLSKATAGFNLQNKLLIATNAASAVSFNAAAIASGNYAVATSVLATAKLRLTAISVKLLAVLRAHPFIAATGAIVALTQVINHLSTSTERAVRKFEDLADKSKNTGDSIQNYASQIAEAEEKGKGWNHIADRLIKDFPDLESAVRGAGGEFEELNKVLDTAILNEYREAVENTAKAIKEIDFNLSFIGKMKKELTDLASANVIGLAKNVVDVFRPAARQEKADEEEKWLKARELNLQRAAATLTKLGVDVRSTTAEIETILISSGISKGADKLAAEIKRIFDDLEAKVDKKKRIPTYYREFFDSLAPDKQQQFYEAFRNYRLDVAKELDALGDNFESEADRMVSVQGVIARNADSIAKELMKFGLDYDEVVERMTRPQSLNLFDGIIKGFQTGNEDLTEEAKKSISTLVNLNDDIYAALQFSSKEDPFRFIEIVEDLSDLSTAIDAKQKELIGMGRNLEDPAVKAQLAEMAIEGLHKILGKGIEPNFIQQLQKEFLELGGVLDGVTLASLKHSENLAFIEKAFKSGGESAAQLATQLVGLRNAQNVVADNWMERDKRGVENFYATFEEANKYIAANTELTKENALEIEIAEAKILAAKADKEGLYEQHAIILEIIAKKEKELADLIIKNRDDEIAATEALQIAVRNASIAFYEMTGEVAKLEEMKFQDELKKLEEVWIASRLSVDDYVEAVKRLHDQRLDAALFRASTAAKDVQHQFLELTGQTEALQRIRFEDTLAQWVVMAQSANWSIDEIVDAVIRMRNVFEEGFKTKPVAVTKADDSIEKAIQNIRMEYAKMRNDMQAIKDLEWAEEVKKWTEEFKTAGKSTEQLEAFLKELEESKAQELVEELRREYLQLTEQLEELQALEFQKTLALYNQYVKTGVEGAKDLRDAYIAAAEAAKILKAYEDEYGSWGEEAGDYTDALREAYDNARKSSREYYNQNIILSKELGIAQTKEEIRILEINGAFEKAANLRKKLHEQEIDLIDTKNKKAREKLQSQIDGANSWSSYWQSRLAQDMGVLDSALDRKRSSWKAYYNAISNFASSAQNSAKQAATDSLYWAIWESDKKMDLLEKDHKRSMDAAEESRQKQIADARKTITDEEELKTRLAEIDKNYYEEVQKLDQDFNEKKKEHSDQFKTYWESFLDSLVKSFAQMVVDLLAEWAKVQALKIIINPIMNAAGLKGFSTEQGQRFTYSGPSGSGTQTMTDPYTGEVITVPAGSTTPGWATGAGAMAGGAGGGYVGAKAGGSIAGDVGSVIGGIGGAWAGAKLGSALMDSLFQVSEKPLMTMLTNAADKLRSFGSTISGVADKVGNGLSNLVNTTNGTNVVVGEAAQEIKNLGNTSQIAGQTIGSSATQVGLSLVSVGATMYAMSQSDGDGAGVAGIGGALTTTGAALGWNPAGWVMMAAGAVVSLLPTVMNAIAGTDGGKQVPANYLMNQDQGLMYQAGDWEHFEHLAQTRWEGLLDTMNFATEQYGVDLSNALVSLNYEKDFSVTGGAIGIWDDAANELVRFAGESSRTVYAQVAEFEQITGMAWKDFNAQTGLTFDEFRNLSRQGLAEVSQEFGFSFEELKNITRVGADEMVVMGMIIGEEMKKLPESVREALNTIEFGEWIQSSMEGRDGDLIHDSYYQQMTDAQIVAHSEMLLNWVNVHAAFSEETNLFLADLINKFNGPQEAVAAFGNEMLEVGLAFASIGEEFTSTSQLIDASFVRQIEHMAAFMDAQGTLQTSTEDITDKIQEYAEANGMTAASVAELLTQMGVLGEEYLTVTGHGETTAHQMQALAEAFQGLYSDTENADNALGGLQSQLNALEGQGGESAKAFAIVQDAMKRLGITSVQAGDQSNALAGLLENELTGAAGEAGSKVSQMIRDIIAALRDAGRYAGEAKSARDRAYSADDAIRTRAKGGPVARGMSYLVGEEGPEIVTMEGAGYVYTAEETARMLGLKAFANGGSFGTTIHEAFTYQPSTTPNNDNSGFIQKEIKLLELMGREVEALTLQRQLELAQIEDAGERELAALIQWREEEIRVMQEAKDALEDQFDAWKTGLSLSTQLAELTGNEEWALNIQYQERLIILKGLRDTYGEHSDALIDVQEKIWDLTDANKAAAKEFEVWRQGLGIQAKFAELYNDEKLAKDVLHQQRLIELEGIDKQHHAMQWMIWAREDEIDTMQKVQQAQQNLQSAASAYLAGLQKEIQPLRDAYNDAKTAVEGAIQRERQLIEARKNAATGMSNLINQLRGSEHAPVQSREFFDNQYNSLIAAMDSATTAEEISAAASALTSFVPSYLDFHAAYGDEDSYVTLFNSVVADLERTGSLQNSLAQDANANLTTIEAAIGITQDVLIDLNTAYRNYQNAKAALDNSWMTDEIAKLDAIVNNTASISDLRQAFLDAQHANTQAEEPEQTAEQIAQTLYGPRLSQIEAEKGLDVATHFDWLLGNQANRDYYAHETGETPMTYAEALQRRADDPIYRMIEERGRAYLQRYPDVAADGFNSVQGAIDHYFRYGRSEGRFFRDGGISFGPESGYGAVLHGTEAVVPLPNGRSIPVEMNAGEMLNELRLLRKEVAAKNESAHNFKVNVKIGERELNEMTTNIIRTDPEAQYQIRRVAHVH